MKNAPLNPVTAEELNAALPEILAAPRHAGIVRVLCSRPQLNERHFPQELTFTRGKGVTGDFHASDPWLKLPDGSPDPRIEVSIISSRVLDLVWRERDRVAHPGDNIAVDMALNEADFPEGTLLSVGTAVLRISDVPNDGCAKWKVRCGRAAYDWILKPEHGKLRLRGLYCSVEKDGRVSLGDRIRRL